jgi:hypothetical protein
VCVVDSNVNFIHPSPVTYDKVDWFIPFCFFFIALYAYLMTNATGNKERQKLGSFCSSH